MTLRCTHVWLDSSSDKRCGLQESFAPHESFVTMVGIHTLNCCIPPPALSAISVCSGGRGIPAHQDLRVETASGRGAGADDGGGRSGEAFYAQKNEGENNHALRVGPQQRTGKM